MLVMKRLVTVSVTVVLYPVKRLVFDLAPYRASGSTGERCLHQPGQDPVEDRLLLPVRQEALPEVAQGGVVEGPLIEPQAQGVLHLDVVGAGPLHLPVGEVPVELQDRGEREEGRGDRGTPVVWAVHRRERLVPDQGSHDLPEFPVEAVGRDE